MCRLVQRRRKFASAPQAQVPSLFGAVIMRQIITCYYNSAEEFK